MLQHLNQRFMQFPGIWCGIAGRYGKIGSNLVADCTNQTRFDPHLSQCVVNKPCTGRLSIGSCHSKQFQLLGWIAKKCCTQLAVYLPCIRKQ